MLNASQRWLRDSEKPLSNYHGDTVIVTGRTHTKGISGGNLSIRSFSYGYIRQRRPALAFACRPFLKAADKEKGNSPYTNRESHGIRSGQWSGAEDGGCSGETTSSGNVFAALIVLRITGSTNAFASWQGMTRHFSTWRKC